MEVIIRTNRGVRRRIRFHFGWRCWAARLCQKIAISVVFCVCGKAQVGDEKKEKDEKSTGNGCGVSFVLERVKKGYQKEPDTAREQRILPRLTAFSQTLIFFSYAKQREHKPISNNKKVHSSQPILPKTHSHLNAMH